jgi:hypothetical protein
MTASKNAHKILFIAISTHKDERLENELRSALASSLYTRGRLARNAPNQFWMQQPEKKIFIFRHSCSSPSPRAPINLCEPNYFAGIHPVRISSFILLLLLLLLVGLRELNFENTQMMMMLLL